MWTKTFTLQLSREERQELAESAMEQIASGLNKVAEAMRGADEEWELLLKKNLQVPRIIAGDEHDMIVGDSVMWHPVAGTHVQPERPQHASQRSGGTTRAAAAGTSLDKMANPVPPGIPTPANLGLPNDSFSLDSTIWARPQESGLGICNNSQSADFLVADYQRCQTNKPLAKPYHL